MRSRPYEEILTLASIAGLSALFIVQGGYVQWLTGYVLVFLIQGYVAWFLFSKCNQPFYGYAFTMAIGAYSTIVTSTVFGWRLWGGLLLGGLLSCLAASLLFVLTSRARGFYVGMVSFLLAILFPSLIEALGAYTGGRSGLSFVGLMGVIGFEGMLWLLVGVTVAVAGSLFWLLRTKTGRILTAIAQNDTLAKAIGLNTFLYKLLAFAVSGFISGIGGGLYVNYVGSISSIDLGVLTTIYITFIPILGGMSTPYGPILGTLFIRVVPDAFGQVERYLDMIFGAAFIFVVVAIPGGIGDFVHNQLAKLGCMWLRCVRSSASAEVADKKDVWPSDESK